MLVFDPAGTIWRQKWRSQAQNHFEQPCSVTFVLAKKLYSLINWVLWTSFTHVSTYATWNYYDILIFSGTSRDCEADDEEDLYMEFLSNLTGTILREKAYQPEQVELLCKLHINRNKHKLNQVQMHRYNLTFFLSFFFFQIYWNLLVIFLINL